jgi:hypothetical protein
MYTSVSVPTFRVLTFFYIFSPWYFLFLQLHDFDVNLFFCIFFMPNGERLLRLIAVVICGFIDFECMELMIFMNCLLSWKW